MSAFLLSGNKNMQHLPWKLLGAATLIGLAFDILIFHSNYLGLNVLLFQLIFLSVSIGLAYYLKLKLSAKLWVASAFSLLYASTFAIWTSEIGLTLSGFGLVIANSFFILFLFGHHNNFRHPLEIPIAHFKHTFLGVIKRIEILEHFQLPGFSHKSSSIGRGIIITIPILVIFALLFIGADKVLAQHAKGFLHDLQTFFEEGKIVGHIIGTVVVSAIMLSIFATAFWRKLEFKLTSELVPKFKIESAIILSAVSALFLVFLLMQSYYLFGGEFAWNSIEGITYAEYAVNGFGELAAIVILVLSLILTLRYFHTESTKKLIVILESILICETLLVVGSAWLRLNLYVSKYGFTPARLFGFWFFITISVTLLLLLINIMRKQNQAKFMQQTMLFIGGAMLVFTMSAPDALTVRLNINRATAGKPMDIFPLFNELSAEAYPLMSRVINTHTTPIVGIIEPQPEIEYYCGYYFDRRSRDNAYVIDTETRIDIGYWQRDWNNFHYKYSRDGKGTPEFKYSFKSWNLSRNMVPQNEYDFIDPHATIPFTNSELKAVCDSTK